MLIKHFVLYFLFNISLNVCGVLSKKSFTPANGEKLLQSVIKLTDSLIEVTPYLNSTLAEIPANCVQMLCKFVCFNGISTDIEIDVLMVSKKNNNFCSHIDELRLYNYAFPNGKISYGFLGTYSDKVGKLYLASTNITDVDDGAFAKGKFKEINFENLQLKELRKDFFKGISHDFNALSIIQQQIPIERVNTDFLCNVKYLIKSLTLQAGLKSISNLTGGDFLLNNLAYADFSHNDFDRRMEYTAFSKVSMLEWLDLSYSNLEYIPPYLFADFIDTLEYLNLSYNKLKTISRYIFGWREIPRDLKIYAEGNEWSCSCDLQKEIRFIFLHYRAPFVCSEPDAYQGLTVFDSQICDENIESQEHRQEGKAKNSEEDIFTDDDNLNIAEQTTETQLVKTANNSDLTSSVPLLPPNLIKLDCLASGLSRNESTSHLINWPLIVFNLIPQESLHIDVVVNSTKKRYDSFGLIWFSKVTRNFYKMEINYNEYGLGCYKNISFVTTVRDLVPNTAYTFCLVFKQQLTVSPFSCKSIHVSDNLAAENSAWLNQDMKMAGLSLVIFGVVVFLFAGIIMIYCLLKRKPTLLKGSKRVPTLNSGTEEIVVLPKKKSLRSIREKEEKLAKYGPFPISQKRRKSNVSVVSYESYINSNVYEVIPAFQKLDINNSTSLISSEEQQTTQDAANNQEMDYSYLTPLESTDGSKNFVQYTKIPYRLKRNSHDVLPQLPADLPPLCSPLSQSENIPEYAQIGNIYFFDSHI